MERGKRSVDLDTALLFALACCPFLTLGDLTVAGAAPTSTVHRTLHRLRAQGLIERVPLGADKAYGYCLTGDGILVVAQRAGREPDELCTTFGLGRRQLVARLPQLGRLSPIQSILVFLADELRAGGGELVAYMGGPLRWRTRYQGADRARGQVVTATLDGQAALRTPQGVLLHTGFLWDGDDVGTPASELGYRLAQIRAVRRDPARLLPPVLVITTGEDRLARSGHALPPDVLWTTDDETRERGVLAARWVRRSASGAWEVRPLLEHLLALPAAGHAPWRYTPRTHSPARAGVRLALEERVAALRRGRVEARPAPPGLLALAAPPRMVAVLDAVGRYPLLLPPQLAEILGQEASRVRATLALLRRHDLVTVQHLDASASTTQPPGRYALSGRGLHLLASRSGLPLPIHRALYDLLEDSPWGRHHGFSFALGNAAHTQALQEVLFAFVRAARMHGGTLTWRGEWACVRAFTDSWNEERRLVRPDAEVFYHDARQRLHLFVEVDRSRRTHSDLGAQLGRYHDYAAQLPDERSVGADGVERVRRPPVTLALITTESAARARNLLQTAAAVATALQGTQVRVCAASLSELLHSGDVLGRVWRHGAQAELVYLSARLTRSAGVRSGHN